MAHMNSDYDLLGFGYDRPVRPTQSDIQNTNNQLKLSVLKDENEKLRKQYADLVRKTTILIEAYEKLEAENDSLKSKKAKRDSVIKTVENWKNFLKNIWNNFIDWLNT